MQVPFFYEENLPNTDKFFLNEETSKHIVQVLRMKENENLFLTNGKGQTLFASIVSANKKKTEVTIIKKDFFPKKNNRTSIAISLLKNNNRFEWFLEKATEIGVAEIIPLICHRTEKQNFRFDRMKNILVSAMLQSQQQWLPELQEPIKFEEIIKKNYQNKYIAHCADKQKKQLSDEVFKDDSIILIGPEGDFTKDEIDAAVKNNFNPVSLGATRLRTETAGIVAAVLLLNK